MSSIICSAAGFILLAILLQANFDKSEKKLNDSLIELKKNEKESIELGRDLDAIIDILNGRENIDKSD